MRKIILTIVICTTPGQVAVAASPGVANPPPARNCHWLAHSNAAEMTLSHFWGRKVFSQWGSTHGHAEAAELVESTPAWKAWEFKHLDCGDGSCNCVEK